MINEIIITRVIIKHQLDINSRVKPSRKSKEVFYCRSLLERVGGLLPKRHFHSFRQSNKFFFFFALLAQHRLTVLHIFIHFQGRGGRKINIISPCIHISQRRRQQKLLYRTGLNSAADPGLVQPLIPRAAADWLFCVSARLGREREKKCTLQQQRTLRCLKNYVCDRCNN